MSDEVQVSRRSFLTAGAGISGFKLSRLVELSGDSEGPMYPTWISAISLIATLAACASVRVPAVSPDSDAAVRQTIANAGRHWAEAMERGDASSALAYYADDAVLSLPNTDDIRGRAAILESTRQFLATTDVRDVRVTPTEVRVCGDTAYELGTYAMSLSPRGEQARTDRGRYVVVWRRQSDSSWRIVRDISVTSVAAVP